MIALYDGKVFFSRGNIHKNYEVHSIREAFLSALYGIHFTRGNIDLNATLEDLNIDDITPGLTISEKQARVDHLLTSRSGVYHQAADEDQTMIDERPARGSYAPDTFFYYNNWDVNALGTIFEQETGEEIFSAFKKEIADVLEMVDFSSDNFYYHYEWNKSMHPAGKLPDPSLNYGFVAVNFTLTTWPCTTSRSSSAGTGVNSSPGQHAMAFSSCGVRMCRDTTIILTKPTFFIVFQ
ncbi:MAG: serine hydrolase [Desulfobacterales bacterium]|nr:serine hydrolase [Desulfobacterales bacterium]